MYKHAHVLAALPLMLLGSLAQAQTAGTISFSANKTSATGSLTPVLTWSTTPVASSCVASGAWSGTKFASGSETLPSISASKSYTLTCSWGNGSATINWGVPTTNTDGSKLTDLASYKVLYGTSASALTNSQAVNDPKATSATIAALGKGTWYFAVRAVNSAGQESANSNVAQKSITGASGAKTVNITITPSSPTNPPAKKTLQTVSKYVYEVAYSNGTRTTGRQVGTIAYGKPCELSYKVGTSYYKVTNRSDVTLTRQPRSSTLISHCALMPAP